MRSSKDRTEQADMTIRVLMVLPQYPPPVLGGLERQAHELTVAVRALGVDAWVLSGATETQPPGESEIDGVPVVRVPFPSHKGLRFPVAGGAIAGAMGRRRRRFDVLHSHNLSWFGALAVLCAKALGKPVLGKLPTATKWAFPEGSFRMRLFQRCDAIALMSRDSVEDFRRMGYPDGRIFRITNGVSTRRFHPPSERAEDAGRALVVSYMGRLDPEKGLLDLLAVWPDVLRRAGRPARLLIGGEGPQQAELAAAIRSAGLDGSVTLRGHVADVPAALREADVFVLPSYVEGNSNAVLEAMATGLPVVSTHVGGTPLLVGAEGERWLSAPRDREALLRSLTALLSDAALRRAAGAAMLRRARDVLSIEAVAERYVAVYERLASGRPDEVASASTPVF